MQQATAKPPLLYEELRDVIDLALFTGQLLLHYGAPSQRVEETVHRLGTGLGCDWIDVLVSPNAIIVTTTSGKEFRTKIRRVVNIAVNMSIVDQISDVSRKAYIGQLDRIQVRAELERISELGHHYNRWLTIGLVGLSCAAFSRLFGGDIVVLVITFTAAATAMFVRQELQKRYFNPLIVVVVTAFVAGIIASTATVFNLSDEPDIALAASVLLLVPGVPLITASEDLIQGHLVTGIVRGVWGGLISLSIALGLLIAVRLMGIGGL